MWAEEAGVWVHGLMVLQPPGQLAAGLGECQVVPGVRSSWPGASGLGPLLTQIDLGVPHFPGLPWSPQWTSCGLDG